MNKGNRIAVLWGGGLDGTVAAVLAALSGRLEALIWCDYGQATRVIHESHGKQLARYLKCGFETMKFPYKRFYEKGQFVTYKQEGSLPGVFVEGFAPSRENPREELGYLPSNEDFCWLEGRNPMLMFNGAIFAAYLGCDILWTGFQYNHNEIKDNTAPYPPAGDDTTRHCIDSVNQLISFSFSRPVRIETPLAGLDKKGVIQLARNLNVPTDLTYSCEFTPRCGKCEQCLDRGDV